MEQILTVIAGSLASFIIGLIYFIKGNRQQALKFKLAGCILTLGYFGLVLILV